MVAAQQLVKSGKYRQAGEAFGEVLKLSPGRSDAELGLADSLQKSGQHQAALDHYRAAGASLAAALGRARSLVALKQLEEARKVLEDSLPQYPSDVTLRLELSRVYARLGQPELAAEQAKIIERLRAQ
jgi:thioredoxin-like negative regulator of GroEL